VARASVSTLAAATLVLVALTTVAAAALRVSRESSVQLSEYLRDLYRVYSATVEVRASEGGVVITSSTPLRLLAAYLVEGGGLTEVCEEVYVDGPTTIGDGNLVGRLRASGKLLLVFEGGRYLVVSEDPATESGGLVEEAYGISRLLPLLAQYLDPEGYDSITSSYAPVAVAVLSLTPYYRPYVRWSTGSSTRYCYDDLVYVRLTWDSSNWYVTYRKCASDGPVLDTVTVPRSQTSVPYREWLYNSTCLVSNGIRYCFEVYAYASGFCEYDCGNPPNSWWAFEVGMRVVYRFEPVEPGYYVLVILNRTTYENALARGLATCSFYHTTAVAGCVICSTGVALCNYPSSSQVVSTILGGYGPVFWWNIGRESRFEHLYGDDGYEEGAWYPRTSVSAEFRIGTSYAYAYSASVVVDFRKSGLRPHESGYRDYLRRYSTYQDGYYRVRFELVFDEGGLGTDARAWDYRAVVFLMKRLS